MGANGNLPEESSSNSSRRSTTKQRTQLYYVPPPIRLTSGTRGGNVRAENGRPIREPESHNLELPRHVTSESKSTATQSSPSATSPEGTPVVTAPQNLWKLTWTEVMMKDKHHEPDSVTERVSSDYTKKIEKPREAAVGVGVQVIGTRFSANAVIQHQSNTSSRIRYNINKADHVDGDVFHAALSDFAEGLEGRYQSPARFVGRRLRSEIKVETPASRHQNMVHQRPFGTNANTTPAKPIAAETWSIVGADTYGHIVISRVSQAKNDLDSKMEAFFAEENNAEALRLNPDVIIPTMVVIALVNGRPIRAEVRSAKGPNTYLVLDIDSFESHIVDVTNLKKPPEDFLALQSEAVKCVLKGLEGAMYMGGIRSAVTQARVRGLRVQVEVYKSRDPFFRVPLISVILRNGKDLTSILRNTLETRRENIQLSNGLPFHPSADQKKIRNFLLRSGYLTFGLKSLLPNT